MVRTPARARPEEVRIIGGRWRGRRLPVADREGLRPTPDRVRETLFNWLAPGLPGAACLDLCAGTGVLGLEALSRGAETLDLIERDPATAAAIREAVVRLDAAAARVHATDALLWLAQPPSPVHLAFIDPPWASGLAGPLLARLASGGWLREDALVYLEWRADEGPPTVPALLAPHRSGRAGAVGFGLWKRVAGNGGQAP